MIAGTCNFREIKCERKYEQGLPNAKFFFPVVVQSLFRFWLSYSVFGILVLQNKVREFHTYLKYSNSYSLTMKVCHKTLGRIGLKIVRDYNIHAIARASHDETVFSASKRSPTEANLILQMTADMPFKLVF